MHGINLKISNFWDTTPRSLMKVSWRFGGTCCLHMQGVNVSQARNLHVAGSKQIKSTCFSEILVDFQRTTRRYIIEDANRRNHRRGAQNESTDPWNYEAMCEIWDFHCDHWRLRFSRRGCGVKRGRNLYTWLSTSPWRSTGAWRHSLMISTDVSGLPIASSREENGLFFYTKDGGCF
jgi:hypothetical protein